LKFAQINLIFSDNVHTFSMQTRLKNEDAKLDLHLFEMHFYENETK